MDDRDLLSFEIRSAANAIVLSAAAMSRCLGTNECLEFLTYVQEEAERMESLMDRLAGLDKPAPAAVPPLQLQGVLAA